MGNNRDNFTKATIEILAKRVGYLCSNPNCRLLTIGANEQEGKTTSIGNAAHITAASSGGKRYDDNLTAEERCHIDNGLWLCTNCATLIDKDELKYTVNTLKKWKEDAENETRQKLNGEFFNQPIGSPFIEADLIFRHGGRFNMGYSQKNPTELHEGRQVIMLGNGRKSIVHWKLTWDFNFTIYNNSNYPAYNISVESIGNEHFSYLDKLNKINNIPPLQNIDLQAKYEFYIESDRTNADNIRKLKIPEKFNDLVLKISYSDDQRKEHITYVEFLNGEISNRKV